MGEPVHKVKTIIAETERQPMNTQEKLFVDFWSVVIDQLGGSPSYDDMAELTHETQVALFGFCSCEDNEGNENPYEDCPEQ